MRKCLDVQGFEIEMYSTVIKIPRETFKPDKLGSEIQVRQIGIRKFKSDKLGSENLNQINWDQKI